MGWTSYHVAPIYKNGKQFIDRKAECDRLFNCSMVNNLGKYEVLKSSMVGSTYYAAVKITTFATETEPEKVDVFAGIVLTIFILYAILSEKEADFCRIGEGLCVPAQFSTQGEWTCGT